MTGYPSSLFSDSFQNNYSFIHPPFSEVVDILKIYLHFFWQFMVVQRIVTLCMNPFDLANS